MNPFIIFRSAASNPRCRSITLVCLVLAGTSFMQTGHAVAETAIEPMSALKRVYAGVLMFRHFHSVCDQVVPANAGAHQAAYQGFARKHSVARIEKFFAVTPNPVPGLAGVKAAIDQKAPSIAAQIEARPETCSVLGQVFENLVSKKMGSPGITNLGAYFDRLLTQAKLGPAGPAAAPSATPQPPANDTTPASGRIETLQDIYEASVAIPRFRAICDQVVPDQAPVHKAIFDSFATRHSLARITAHFTATKTDFPWIAAADKKVEEGLVKVRAVIEKKPKACSALMLVLENLIEKKGGVPDLGALFDRLVAGAPAETVPAAVPTPPAGIEMIDGVPPQAGQVIYAEKPVYRSSSLTLSGYYDDEVRFFDTAKVERDGAAIELDETTFYYVAPQSDGATIEGVFKSSSGYAGIGISVLKTKTLVFGRNGRYSTSASRGVIGGVINVGSGSDGDGSYKISGYTIELHPDDGPVERVAFFLYHTKTFWPDSDAPGDEVNFLNIGGKVLYRDDD